MAWVASAAARIGAPDSGPEVGAGHRRSPPADQVGQSGRAQRGINGREQPLVRPWTEHGSGGRSAPRSIPAHGISRSGPSRVRMAVAARSALAGERADSRRPVPAWRSPGRRAAGQRRAARGRRGAGARLRAMLVRESGSSSSARARARGRGCRTRAGPDLHREVHHDHAVVHAHRVRPTGMTGGRARTRPVNRSNRPPWRGHSTGRPSSSPSPRSPLVVGADVVDRAPAVVDVRPHAQRDALRP